MIALPNYRKADETGPLKPLETVQRTGYRESKRDETNPTPPPTHSHQWDEDEPIKADLPSAGDLSDLPDLPGRFGTESSSPKANGSHCDSTFSQSIRVLHNYSVRVQKIVGVTAYVRLSEGEGEAIYAQRRIDDFGTLSVQEGDLLTLRVFIEDNELKHAFDKQHNSRDPEAYAAFCREIADIYPE